MDFQTLYAFVISSLVLTISPGPDIIYVLSQSIIKGKKSAIMVSLGLTSGLLIHTFFVSIGLSLIIIENKEYLFFLKTLSVMYFLYLIFKVYVNRNIDLNFEKKNTNRNEFYKGLVMNLLNPKVGLFFVALFPGFLFHNQLSDQTQFFILGFIFWFQATMIFLIVSVYGPKLNFFKSQKSKFYLVEILIYLVIIYWVIK
ncbi:MAG: LysE family translocator [Flavobacteriaceae bacterium]|jgi:threonine/homoserine/homoserine lactone efflux protein